MSNTGGRSGVQTLPPSGIYSLKWNNFSQHLATGLRQLFDEDDYTDVTLACDGQFIRAHKFLLSLCSPFFKKLFQANTNGRKNGDDTIVILNNVRFKDLENILRFIYNGEANVNNADLTNFLQTGELLQIEGLSGFGNSDQVPPKDEENVGTGDFPNVQPRLPPPSTSSSLLASIPTSPTVQTRYRPAVVGLGQQGMSTVNTTTTNSVSRQGRNLRLVRPQQSKPKTLASTRNVDQSPKFNTSVPEIDDVDPLEIADTDMPDPDTSAETNDMDTIHEHEPEMLMNISDLKNQQLQYYSPEPAHEEEMTFGDSTEDSTFNTYEGYQAEVEETSYATNKSSQAVQNNGSHSRTAVVKTLTSSDIAPRRKRSALWNHFTIRMVEVETEEKTVQVVQCDYCPLGSGQYKYDTKSNKSTGNMKWHLLKMHPEIEPELNAFNDRSNLSRHMATVHTKLLLAEGKRLFRCSICKATYRTLTHLQIHMQKHEAAI